jgi:hypothetical protein
MEDQIEYRPKTVEEEVKFIKEMIDDINQAYDYEAIRYDKHEHSDKYNWESHYIQVNIFTSIMTYEANFIGILSFFNGIQMGKTITENRIATQIMAFKEEFSEVIKNMIKTDGDPSKNN